MVCHLISAWMIVNCTSPAAMAKNSSVPRVLACINEIADWIASNRLMLKSSKIDLLWCSMRWYSDGVALTDVAQCVCWTIPSCLQPWRESRQGALTFYLRQPTGSVRTIQGKVDRTDPVLISLCSTVVQYRSSTAHPESAERPVCQ